MNGPERLGEAGSDLARHLLGAAREELPSRASLQRALAALGVGASVLTASGIAGTAAAGAGAAFGGSAGTASAIKIAPFGLFGVAVKWLGIGAVGGLMTAGALQQTGLASAPRSEASPPQSIESKPSRPPSARPSPRLAAPAGLPETADVPAPSESRRAARPPQTTPHPTPALAAEVAAVDRAREAVASGNAERALGELDAYERGFAERRLMPEALYLRMEALAQRGDTAASRAAARKLLAADPNGPHAARARARLAAP